MKTVGLRVSGIKQVLTKEQVKTEIRFVLTAKSRGVEVKNG